MNANVSRIADGARAPSDPTPAQYAMLRLRGLYGSKVTRELSSEAAVRLWVREADAALAKRGIGKSQLDHALEVAVDTMEWPPLDIPTLVRLCLPVQDFESAFKEAQHQAYRRQSGLPDEWSHPSIYWAADRFGWFEVRNTSWCDAKKCWSKVLNEVLDWREWPPFDLVRLTTEKRLQTRDVQVSELGKMRQILREASARQA
jgi:hypothetical protein